jgi:phosphate uptake regulator
METRKVQISGGSTYIISLPKKWADRNGIAAGSNINIMEDRSGNLIVSPRPISFRESIVGEIKITGSESHDAIMRRLVGAYVSGATAITVSSKEPFPPEVARAVREFTRLVMGVEIVEERQDNIQLQDLIDPADFSIKSGLKRMSYITERMIEDAIRAITEKDIALLDDVILRDVEVDRITWLIQKEYNMLIRSPKLVDKTQVPLDQALNYVLASRVIERIADHAVGMAKHLKDGDLGSSAGHISDVQQLGYLNKDIFSDAVKALFSQEMDMADNVIDRARTYRKRIDEMQRKIFDLPADEAVLLAQLLTHIERVGAYGADIGKMTLNRSYAVK